MTYDLLARLGLDTQDFTRGVEAASSSMGRLGGFAMAGLGIAAGAVGGAILGIGAAAWNVGTEIDSASRQMAASLGETLEESENLQSAMIEVWGQGLNVSIEETGSAITVVSQQMKGLADDDIADATTSALKLMGVFEDADLERSTGAANILMNMGVEAEKAFEIIATGYQEGLNTSGDWLDSIGEYGNLFDEAGFSAEQMFSLMQSGLQGGVLGTDKISDAIKEFGIIMNEGGEDASAAFATIGLSYEEIATEVSSEKADWGDYFDEIVGGLNSIDDPMLRSQTQVALFGTAAEDLGVSFTQGLTASATSLDDFSGSMEALNVRYEDFAGMAERFKRRFLVALLPLRDSLLELANQAMPYVEAAFGWLETTLPPMLDKAGQALSLLGAGDLEGLANLWSDLGPKVETFAINIYAWIETTKEGLRTRFLMWGETLVGWLTENSPAVLDAAGQLATMLMNFIALKAIDIQTNFLMWGEAALGWIETSGPSMLVKAEEIAISLLAWITAKDGEIRKGFQAWGVATISWIDESSNLLLRNVEAIGIIYLGWISAKSIEISTAFVTWGQSLIAWIVPATINFLAEWPLMLYGFLTWIEGAAGPILLSLGNWSISFIEWIAPMVPNLIVGLGAVALAIVAFITSTTLVLGIKLIEWAAAFVGWIATEAVPRLWTALQALEDALTEWIEWGIDWLWEQGESLGTSLLDGILNMLKNAGGVIAGVINQAIENAIANVKAQFGIQSPSKVFADEIGKPLAEGIGKGVTGNKSAIAGALTDSIDYGRMQVSYSGNIGSQINNSRASQTSQISNISINVTAAAGQEQVAARQMSMQLDNALMRARARGYA